MNRTVILMLVSLFGLSSLASDAIAEDASVIRLSEPVAVSDEAEVFGAALNPSATPVELDVILDNPEAYEDSVLLVRTRVSEVCQKKGCFYIATDGQRAVRVSFKDYGFFLPTDIGGKDVTMTGVLIERELSEAEAAHFRSDTGSDVIQAGGVYELVADAVSVPL